jgi:hypothetical protein
LNRLAFSGVSKTIFTPSLSQNPALAPLSEPDGDLRREGGAVLVVNTKTAAIYLTLFSNVVWHARQYLQAMAFLRLSGIGLPHSSQLIADSPL